jgi:hypothetical protein
MLNLSSDTIINDAFENPSVLKYLNVAGIVVAAAFCLYLVGHLFKVGAHTINGYNELKSAIANGK